MKTTAILALFVATVGSFAAAANGDLETALNIKYKDQILFLRHPAHSDSLKFNSAGELLTPAETGPWTVDGAIEIHELHLSPEKLTFQGARFLYGFELQGKQIRPYKVKDKSRDKAVVEIALEAPLSSVEQADALIDRIFASHEADLISSAPQAWRYFLVREYSKPELVNRAQAAAPSEPDDEKPFTPSKQEMKKMKPPRPVYTPDPAYSPTAKMWNVRGTMVLSAIIDKTGSVRHLRIIRPLGFGLDEQALNTVRTWKFAPATFDGAPVTVEMGIETNFDLQY